MPISTVCVWVWMQPGGAEGEPFARCNLKQFRALGSLCVWLDRSGWTVILLLLFLVLFFLFYWDTEVSALWQLLYSLLSASALAPFFLKWREWARMGWFECVEERSVMVLTSLSPLPYSHSPSLLLSCFIPRVWPPMRSECLMEGSHTCGFSFAHALLHIQVHMHRHYNDCCAVHSAHWFYSTHTWSNCYTCTDTYTHSHSQSGGTTQWRPRQLSSRSLFLQKTDKSCFLKFFSHVISLNSFFLSAGREVWALAGYVCVCMCVCVNVCSSRYMCLRACWGSSLYGCADVWMIQWDRAT